ncbi:hypothetical protein SODALDRAFT_380561 [Sodiomyces alkalinus F11]|uniref:Uncharacterized protein n=1 Tax=Sodiomyces alkalinus (strain CBS 110278 / VKM F-3762 / F11) TaxID=1314773 RepID=A0A3N2PP06_SODAK|nr:hypothetical protein SODALDRAFT_380561 [Sodiomyces alkalinus F11]ROT36229.1 hypothetical protein SODALDRAFT_380561 [Sodiomyces alkalinus F11]
MEEGKSAALSVIPYHGETLVWQVRQQAGGPRPGERPPFSPQQQQLHRPSSKASWSILLEALRVLIATAGEAQTEPAQTIVIGLGNRPKDFAKSCFDMEQTAFGQLNALPPNRHYVPISFDPCHSHNSLPVVWKIQIVRDDRLGTLYQHLLTKLLIGGESSQSSEARTETEKDAAEIYHFMMEVLAGHLFSSPPAPSPISHAPRRPVNRLHEIMTGEGSPVWVEKKNMGAKDATDSLERRKVSV